MSLSNENRWIVAQACELGFDLCGVAPVEDYEELRRLPEWLERGYAGEMGYLRDARRRSPKRVLEGARSLVVCALNYNTSLPYSTAAPSETPAGAARGWISRYAWGDDYHEVLLSKLEKLLERMRAHIAERFEARAYVDTGPVIERIAAKYAGLGWLAKNTCLINPQLGSWLFLGVIVTTLDLPPSLTTLSSQAAPVPDLCGNCTLCIEACPTQAIVEPYLLDARRCISYLTIELRGSIPVDMRAAMGRQIFGCDICQDVCPWNRTAPETTLTALLPRQIALNGETRNAQLETQPTEQRSLFAPELEWLLALSEEDFRQVFRGSAVTRAKWRGLVRNACVALGNSRLRSGTAAYSRCMVQLERLAASEDAAIAEHARWALARLQSRQPETR